jgi:uncharacterized membrane protein YpjA
MLFFVLKGIAITMIDNMEYKHTMYIITTRKYFLYPTKDKQCIINNNKKKKRKKRVVMANHFLALRAYMYVKMSEIHEFRIIGTF